MKVKSCAVLNNKVIKVWKTKELFMRVRCYVNVCLNPSKKSYLSRER